MKRTIFLIGIGLVIVFISCESEDAADVNQQRIETSYYLSYDQKLDETEARAVFTFGSTYLKLNAPSKVLFGGDKLRESEILGIVGNSRKYDGLINSGILYTPTRRKSHTPIQ